MPIKLREGSEDGYMLLAVICMLALFTISLSVAIPEISRSIQRDREIETLHRGKQYIRAIQLYYRKFGSYPPSVDALIKTNGMRFLRKRYLDPMTGKDDWIPIHFGQNKTPLAMGFFGQPIAGLNGTAPVAGVGLSGSNSGANINPTAGTGVPGVNDAGPGQANGGSQIAGGGPTGSGFIGGQTFGGAGVIGFRPASPKPSILLYKKKDHYNEWEFTYSPLMDMKQRPTAGNLIGVPQPSTSSSAPGGSSGSPGGFGGRSSTLGNGADLGGGSNSSTGSSSPPTQPPR